MMYKVILSKQALKDFDTIKQAGYGKKIKELIDIVHNNPYQTPPRYEKLVGELQGYYSRRINEQHRFVYDVQPNIDKLEDVKGELYKGIVHVLRMWTHYE